MVTGLEGKVLRVRVCGPAASALTSAAEKAAEPDELQREKRWGGSEFSHFFFPENGGETRGIA
jgi:hypothetical protein